MKILTEIIYEHDCGMCTYQGNRYRLRVERDGDVVFFAVPRCAQKGVELREVEQVFTDGMP